MAVSIDNNYRSSIGSNPGVSITVSGTTSNGPRNSRTAQGDPIGDSNISSADSDDDITIRIRIRATGLSGITETALIKQYSLASVQIGKIGIHAKAKTLIHTFHVY